MNKLKIYIFMLLLISVSLFADWIELPGNSENQLFEVISQSSGTTRIKFALNGYEKVNITEEDKNFQKISYWNEGQFIETGKPDLPRFTRLVSLPNEGKVSIEIIDFELEILSNITAYPFQGLQSESKLQNKIFSFDQSYYNKGDKFRSQIIGIGNPAIMRDVRVVNVTLNPFQYDPIAQELRIYKNIEFIVRCEGTEGLNTKIERGKSSNYFESIYESSIINYKTGLVRDDEFQQPNYLFISPDDPQVETTLQNLIDWKKQKGFHVVSVNTSQTGTSLNSIKSYIQNAYDTWENPPEFICLVGDAGGNFSIPTGHLENGEGDHHYVLLEGNDILADAFIGRLSFNSIFELQTIIYKILHYEKEPFLGNTNWYNKALFVGDPTTSGQSCVNTKISIKEMMNKYSDNYTFNEVYSAPWVSQMVNGFNEGASYFNYRGYYGMSGWELDDISNLNNGYMLPVAVLLTCSVGDFEGTYDSRTERFLKAGSSGNPKGAIAAIGTATSDTNTCFNNCVDAGIYHGIFVDKIYHLGGALNKGKLNLFNSYPGNPYNAVHKFSYWNNLMGDPGMEIWTGTPEPMIVTYYSDISIGTNLLEVLVSTNAGIPIPHAWVTILSDNEEIFSTGVTDNNGNIYLPLETINSCEVNLTVTKHNYIPHLGIFNIVQNDVFVNVFEIYVDDDNIGSSSGNGNEVINPGESIEFSSSLMNHGSITAESITASITSDDSFITINDSIEFYGNIPANASAYSTDNFDFDIDQNVLGGSELTIDVKIQDISNNEWNDKIYLTVEGANLQPQSYSIIDGNNALLDPGETADLTVTIENIGSVSSNQISSLLTCANSQITIIDPDGYFGDISPGNLITNDSDRFIISANQAIIPGTQFTLELQLFNDEGYDNIVSFNLEVGDVVINDPLGPDEYGYYCYDDGDLDYELAPVYSWIEIDPDYGGSGTILNLFDSGDMGDIEDLDLPFVLRFYGNNYSTITICSNGWISPGSTEQMSFMNWPIPGPLGPSPMIAPFWDDLEIGSGNVCYFYDQAQNYFIIEWSHLQNDYDNSEETFQIILFNSNYYPTITGDSKILFQYKTINNIDQGSYGNYSNHGEFATVGLEDHTGTIGLEYTYSNQYPTAAKVLEDEMAILFSTPSVPNQGPFIILDSFEIDDSQGNNDGIVNPGELVELSITLRNVGFDLATNVSATLLSSDQFISIENSIQYFGNINPASTSTSSDNYSFDVELICPDQHDIIFDLNITAETYSSNSTFVIDVFSSNIAVSANEIYFPEVYSGYSTSLPLTIYNTGSVMLHVSDIYTNTNHFSSDFSTINLESSESQEILITVNLNSIGTFIDTLHIISDDPDEPELEISLIADCVSPPEIELSSYSLNIDLGPDEIASESITISNIGGSNLLIDLEITGNSSSGMAAGFDGIDDYISLSNLAITTAYFTIEMWAKMHGQGGGSVPYSPLFQQREDIPEEHNSTIVLYAKTNTEQARFYVRSNNSNGQAVISESRPYFEWHHYAGVVSEDIISFYIDGNLVDSIENLQAGNYTSNIDYTDIGRHRYSNLTHGLFDGYIDEVRIWDYPKSQDEIQNEQNRTLSGDEQGLNAYWNFDGENPWLDLTGNNINGTPVGGVTILESTAPINNWLSFSLVTAVILPESSVDMDVTFETTDLELGIYHAQIVINCNDPVDPEIVIPITLNIVETGSDETLKPLFTKLENNYPNPFNPTTTIEFSIQAESKIELLIYNIKGQKIKTLISDQLSAGQHSIIWNGDDDLGKKVGSGVYLYKLNVNGKTEDIKKCILLK